MRLAALSAALLGTSLATSPALSASSARAVSPALSMSPALAASSLRQAPRADLRASPPAPPRLLRATVAGQPLTSPSTEPAELIARGFVESLLAPVGEMALVDVVTGGGGVQFVTFEQRFEGRPVAAGRVGVAVAQDGTVVSARVGELAPAGPRANAPSRRLVEAADARRTALAHVGLGAGLSPATGPFVEELWLATATGVESAWRVRVRPELDPMSARELVLSAEDGRLLRREAAGFGAVRARVYPQDPTRGEAWVLFPDPATNPSVHSPAGWTELGFTTGNNVDAHLERGTALSVSGAAALASGLPPTLDFPFTGDPAVDVDAALTNVFWALNDAHDRFRALGFDEASGALQDDSFGRGGNDGDRMHALVQYASADGTEPYGAIASAIGADGTPSFMAVGLFETLTGELRDGAFETDLLYHEYGHAVSTRLFGGEPLCLGGVQPAALLEGWSDFFAASFTDDPVLGAWTSGNAATGQRTQSLDASGLSLLNFCAGTCERFRDGEIWSSLLWDLRTELRDRLGPEAGTELAERLALDAMRYAPCRPTLLDARDALLLAESALSGGEHHCLVWQVALGRGLGHSAATTGPDDTQPDPGFDLPPQCAGGAALRFDHAEYGLSADVRLELVDGTGDAAATPLSIESSSGDSELVTLVSVGPGPLLAAALAIAPGPSLPGDGTLQVADGDVLLARHAATGAEASARVSGGMAVFLVAHLVGGSACQASGDDDQADAPGWGLPGFLDAGENASLSVLAASATEGPLEGAFVTVTSENPAVRVLPDGPISLGTIPSQDRGFGRLFLVDLHASADPTVLPGERARLRFDLTSRGRSGSFVLDLTLNQDYEVQTGLSPFRSGVETFERDSWSVFGWTHRANRPGGDDWRLTDCQAASGRFSFGNVAGDCSSYSEDQGAPVLVSPPLLAALPAEAVRWRLIDLGWKARVDLYTDPIAPFCDADMVGAFFTVNPDALPYDDPVGIFGYGPLRAYWFADNAPDWFDSGPYGYATGPLDVPPGLDQLRLAFVFWNEIFGIEDCGYETLNDGSFHVDDVRFRYDVVSVVPERTPCAATCTLRAELATDPVGPHCAGEPFVLDASATILEDCAGELLFTFDGPGVPAGFVDLPDPRAPALAEDGGEWSVIARCDAEPDCRSVRVVRYPAPQQPGVGGPAPASLRVRREGADLLLSWIGAALPPTYGAYRAANRVELEAGPATWPLLAAVDGEGPSGEGSLRLGGAADSPGVDYLVVFGRDPCTGRPRLP